jgi:hypothetical protein
VRAFLGGAAAATENNRLDLFRGGAMMLIAGARISRIPRLAMSCSDVAVMHCIREWITKHFDKKDIY